MCSPRRRASLPTTPIPLSKFVVRIQAHPSRTELLDPLLASLAPLRVEVSTHSSDPPNPWEGYQQALRSGLEDESNPSHVLILQEDVVVCKNFPKALRKVSKAKPDDPISFFLARLPGYAGGQVYRTAKRGERWIRAYPGDLFFPALAILWPSKVAREFLEWTETARLPGYPNLVASDDAVFGQWIKKTQATAWYTVPSLADHPDQVESVIGRRAQWGKGRNRVALMFCDGDPLAYTW